MMANRDLVDRAHHLRRWTSPALFGLDRALVPMLQQFAHGRLIDAGCGTMPYRRSIVRQLIAYDGFDIRPNTPDARYVGSIMNMNEVPSGEYDVALCSEVLEHVPDPAAAIAELHRVLNNNGVLLLSVPHLSRIHDEPEDYYRYTRYILTRMLEDAGFVVSETRVTGTIFSFLGHQLSSIVVLSTWHLPLIGYLMVLTNLLLIVLPARAFDWLFRFLNGRLPLGYVIRASKTESPSGPTSGTL